MDGHCGNDDRFLAAVDDRGDSVRAVLGLGQLRQLLEFHGLAAEWMKVRQVDPDYKLIKSKSVGPISLSGRIALTHPVSMAALGIPDASAVLGSWAMT